MTSDAALVFSSCPDNTPMIGLHQFQGTHGLDLVRVFYVATLPHVVESALAPYSYPGFGNTWMGTTHRVLYQIGGTPSYPGWRVPHPVMAGVLP